MKDLRKLSFEGFKKIKFSSSYQFIQEKVILPAFPGLYFLH